MHKLSFRIFKTLRHVQLGQSRYEIYSLVKIKYDTPFPIS